MYIRLLFEVIRHQEVCFLHVAYYCILCLPFLIDNCTTVKVEVSLAYNQTCHWTGWVMMLWDAFVELHLCAYHEYNI